MKRAEPKLPTVEAVECRKPAHSGPGTSHSGAENCVLDCKFGHTTRRWKLGRGRNESGAPCPVDGTMERAAHQRNVNGTPAVAHRRFAEWFSQLPRFRHEAPA
jgi:hypothetical protein